MKNSTTAKSIYFAWSLIVFLIIIFILFAGSAGCQDRGSPYHSAHPKHPPQEFSSAQLFAVHESTLLAPLSIAL
jgi:hypothetical protein